MQRSISRLGNILMVVLMILILSVLILQYIPTDYVVYLPGPAEDVGPMVEAEGEGEDLGQFLLTAVYQSYPNMLGYVQLLFNPHAEFHKREEVFVEGETQEQYAGRQQINMLGSQSNAIMAVYEELGIPYHFKEQGLYVQSVMEGYPAEGVLQAWDRIEEIDGVRIESSADLEQYMRTKREGDVIELTYVRAGVRHQTEFALRQLPQEAAEDAEDAGEVEGSPPVGMGVSLLIMRTVEADDERYRVNISAEDIGGPSAGLMFALEIYNRFVPEDISKGYRIAGTGEISPSGEVGVIGGIRHKVVGADSEGADIFLAPADYVDEHREISIPNYSDALRTAEEIGSTMNIVKVATLSDALDYLNQLPDNTSAEQADRAA